VALFRTREAEIAGGLTLTKEIPHEKIKANSENPSGRTPCAKAQEAAGARYKPQMINAR